MIHFRRFAYIHKTDHERFGLLKAIDYDNARQHLGSGFRIRQTWLTEDENNSISFDRERRRQIVESVFAYPPSRP